MKLKTTCLSHKGIFDYVEYAVGEGIYSTCTEICMQFINSVEQRPSGFAGIVPVDHKPETVDTIDEFCEKFVVRSYQPKVMVAFDLMMNQTSLLIQDVKDEFIEQMKEIIEPSTISDGLFRRR